MNEGELTEQTQPDVQKTGQESSMQEPENQSTEAKPAAKHNWVQELMDKFKPTKMDPAHYERTYGPKQDTTPSEPKPQEPPQRLEH